LQARQDQFICFQEEKELTDCDTILNRARIYTGITIRTKNLSQPNLKNVLRAIQLDNEYETPERSMETESIDSHRGVQCIYQPSKLITDHPGLFAKRLCHLRLEDAKLSTATIECLKNWMSDNALLRTLGLVRLKFEDKADFR